MPENEITTSGRTCSTNKSSCYFSLIPIFLDSLKIIFFDNPKLFLIINTFTTLPLSILITSSSVSSTPRFFKSHIARLEWLCRVVPIWIEASNIQDESRADTRRLLRFRLIHIVPIFALSLVAAVLVAVSTRAAFYRKKQLSLSLRAAAAVLRDRWAPPLLTCMVNFILFAGWAHLDPYVNKCAVKYGYLVVVLQVVVEVYMMAVFGLALVVSILEGRVGLDAIWVGSGLMKGRRVSGWVMSGLILLISGFIGRQMVGVMYGEDMEGGYTWTVEMRLACMVGLVVLLGWLILWSYVVFTVYYLDCRKRHVIKEEEQQQQLDSIDDMDI